MLRIQAQRQLRSCYIIARQGYTSILQPLKAILIAVHTAVNIQPAKHKAAIFVIKLSRNIIKNCCYLYFVSRISIFSNIQPILRKNILLLLYNQANIMRIYICLDNSRHTANNNICIKQSAHNFMHCQRHRTHKLHTLLKICQSLFLHPISQNKFFKIQGIHMINFFKAHRERTHLMIASP